MSKLDLSNKNLSKLPDFQPDEYQNTEHLDLSNNQLTSLPSEIGNFTKLQILTIANNQLSSLPPEIGNLENLHHLNLDNNRLTSLPLEIRNLRKLHYLNLDNNCLASLPSVVGELTNLHSLSLNKNKLSSLTPKIGNLRSLQLLCLNNNELSGISKAIGRLTNLMTLDLSDNRIEYLPEEIINLTELKKLSLKGNKIPLPEDKQNLQLIKYVLENQPKLPGSRAHIFRNFSMEHLIHEYGDKLDQVLQQRGIKCKNIEKREDLDDEVTVVFIIIPFDINENSGLIDDITEICEARQIQFHILFHSREHATGDMMNLEKINAVMDLRKKLEDKFAGHIISYESFEHLTDLITEGMRQYSPLIRLRSLRLTNIGHFFRFDNKNG